MRCVWLLTVLGIFWQPDQSLAQSVQDLMNEALRNPAVQDAMRGRVPTVPRVGSADVMEIQRLLNARGFDAGTPDGIAGAGTRRAIAAFQSSIGRSPSGQLTAEELAMLRSGSAASTGQSVRADGPPDAREVQSLLTDLGFDPGPIDGAWGQRSQTALDEFRRRAGSAVSGRPTTDDVALLRAAMAPASGDTVRNAETVAAPPSPTLYALPVVDRNATFSVAWDNAPEDFRIAVVPLWSESLETGSVPAAMPMRLWAPDKAGRYHVVMIDEAGAKVVTRLSIEVR